MKKLLILSNASGYGGAEKSIEILLRPLSEKYNITIITENLAHADELSEIKDTQQITCKIIRLIPGNGMLTLLKNCTFLYKLLRENKPDYILANTNKAGFYLALLSYMKLPKNNIFLYIRDFQWKYRWFIMCQLKQARLLFPTAALLEKKNYIDTFMRKHKFFYLGDPIAQEEQKARQVGEQYILCLANLSRWKGIDYLIESYAECMKTVENSIKLVICGSKVDDLYYNKIQQLIRDKNIQKTVNIIPFQKDVGELYSNALFVAITSISDHGGPETFGRTIVEAWSYQKAVIAFKCGGPQYLIDDGINGFLVEEKDINNFAIKMRALITDNEIRNKLGQNGYKKAQVEYSSLNIAQKMVDIFENKNSS